MAIHHDSNEQSKAIVEEYMQAVNILLGLRKGDDGVYGYTALLILLSIIDALGQSETKTRGANLDILKQTPFNLPDEIVKQINMWYRNGLVHVAGIPNNLFISLGGEYDNPFLVEQISKHEYQISAVNLKSLNEKISSLWKNKKSDIIFSSTFAKAPKEILTGDMCLDKTSVSTFTTPASGCTSIP
ncbi:MAG: hypothetical protein M1492_05585, partial [Gammaproteobacteria bacterium]|nr:hypothetical protein [Gammaproteobacteria bacterium]